MARRLLVISAILNLVLVVVFLVYVPKYREYEAVYRFEKGVRYTEILPGDPDQIQVTIRNTSEPNPATEQNGDPNTRTAYRSAKLQWVIGGQGFECDVREWEVSPQFFGYLLEHDGKTMKLPTPRVLYLERVHKEPERPDAPGTGTVAPRS